jgi:type II secretory pathway pseudopilin PulG
VTLLELVVVVLIILILSTTAIGVYSGQVSRARVAATHDLIRQLDVAISRYEMDTGAFPPSGSGPNLTPSAADRVDGSGYLHLALVYSMSGSPTHPASATWHGPYINVQADQVGAPTTADALIPGMLNLLDPWNSPIHYVQNADYAIPSPPPLVTMDFTGGTLLFATTAPTPTDTGGALVNPNLPAPNPFVSLGETYYNPTTYQLISYGPNGRTLVITASGQIYPGTENDDVTNFGY